MSKLTTPKFQRRSFSEDRSSEAVAALTTDTIPTSHSQPNLHTESADSQCQEKEVKGAPQDGKLPQLDEHPHETHHNEETEHDSYFQQDVNSDMGNMEQDPCQIVEGSSSQVSSSNISGQPTLSVDPSISIAIPTPPERLVLLSDDRNVSLSTKKLVPPKPDPPVEPEPSPDSVREQETPEEASLKPEILVEVPPEAQETSADTNINETQAPLSVESALPPLPPKDTPKSSPLITKRGASTPSPILSPSTPPTASPSPTHSEKQMKRRKSRNPVRELSSASVLSNASGVSDSSKVTDGTDESGAAFMV